MARIKIELPEKFLFETDIIVRISDINYGGHVGHDTVLSLLHEARVQFYRHLGFKDEVNIEGSVGQIVADVAVIYKSESFAGDVLRIEVGIADISRFGFDIFYKVTNKATGKEVAIAKTGIVCFDYTIKKVASIPESLRQQLKGDF